MEVLALDPAEVPQTLAQAGEPGLALRIGLALRDQDGDPAHRAGTLRPGRQGQQRRGGGGAKH
jgi:hypothetical protein